MSGNILLPSEQDTQTSGLKHENQGGSRVWEKGGLPCVRNIIKFAPKSRITWSILQICGQKAGSAPENACVLVLE